MQQNQISRLKKIFLDPPDQVSQAFERCLKVRRRRFCISHTHVVCYDDIEATYPAAQAGGKLSLYASMALGKDKTPPAAHRPGPGIVPTAVMIGDREIRHLTIKPRRWEMKAESFAHAASGAFCFFSGLPAGAGQIGSRQETHLI